MPLREEGTHHFQHYAPHMVTSAVAKTMTLTDNDQTLVTKSPVPREQVHLRQALSSRRVLLQYYSLRAHKQSQCSTEPSGKADSPNSHSVDMDSSADHGEGSLWAMAAYKV